jgi:hypothetical protein
MKGHKGRERIRKQRNEGNNAGEIRRACPRNQIHIFELTELQP